MEPAALLTGLREHLAQRAPKPERAVADGQHRGPHAAAFGVTQQIRPRAGRLAVAVGERDQFLAAVGAYSDQHQQTQLGLLEADLDVDPVSPEVHVIHAGQVPLPERVGLGRPGLGEPGDRRGR